MWKFLWCSYLRKACPSWPKYLCYNFYNKQDIMPPVSYLWRLLQYPFRQDWIVCRGHCLLESHLEAFSPFASHCFILNNILHFLFNFNYTYISAFVLIDKYDYFGLWKLLTFLFNQSKSSWWIVAGSFPLSMLSVLHFIV